MPNFIPDNNVPAKLNVAINNIGSVLNIIFMLALICRAIYGPITPRLVLFYYYLLRLGFTFTLSVLTVKTTLMTFFILDFNRMSGIIMQTIACSAGCAQILPNATPPIGKLHLFQKNYVTFEPMIQF